MINLKKPKTIKSFKSAAILAAAFSLFGCTMEPDYERPETPLDSKVDTLKDFKHAEGLWKEAAPADTLPKGKWWGLFSDPDLDKLIQACRDKNPSLRAAFHAVESARHKARMTESELYPWANGNVSWSRVGISRNENSVQGTFEDYRIGLGLTWDLDFFGRVQALVKSDVALAQAQYAAYENIMLMLEAEVALTYFSIRQYNSEIALLINTAQIRKSQLEKVEHGVSAKYYSDIDLMRARQLYYEAASQLAGVERQRDIAANYLAYITGNVPSYLRITVDVLSEEVPEIPSVVPSMLLERRPDIAEAERQVIAANYRIGSANSAFFPTVQITSSLDMASANYGNLLDSSSLAWGVSPRVYIPIFQAGKLVAQRQIALEDHLQTVESYKDRVLLAISEVETSLSTIKNLKNEYQAASNAAEAARRVEQLARQQLDVGTIDYFEYSDAERLSLTNERARISLLGDRFRSIVSLVKSIGGSPVDDIMTAEEKVTAQ